VKLRRATDSDDGLSLPAGENQLAPVPNIGLDQIVVVFDRPWDVREESLKLFGLATTTYPLADGGFSTAPGEGGALVATWSLAAPLVADRYRLAIDDAATTGLALDGEWTNPAGGGAGDEFPSGDGTPGGDFEFQFAVLPGDADRNGVVDPGDLVWLLSHGFVASGETGYSPWNDINGDGYVNVVDGVLARDRIGDALPVAPPAPAASAMVAGTRASRSRSAHQRAPADAESSLRARDVAIDSTAIDDLVSFRARRARRR
jgi:hypothetical protein